MDLIVVFRLFVFMLVPLCLCVATVFRLIKINRPLYESDWPTPRFVHQLRPAAVTPPREVPESSEPCEQQRNTKRPTVRAYRFPLSQTGLRIGRRIQLIRRS